MTKEEFDDVINENDKLPDNLKKKSSLLPLTWKCDNINHKKWKNSYHNIKYRNQRCAECYYESMRITYKNYLNLIAKRKDKDLGIGITEIEFNDVLKKNDNLSSDLRVKPSKVILKWFCIKGNHIFYAPYDRVRKGLTCNNCSKTNYEDYINLIKSKSKELDIGMSKNEFNQAMKENNKKPSNLRKVPSLVLFRWKCRRGNHFFNATYNTIKNEGTGCSICADRIKAIGYLIHPIIEYYSKFLFNKYNCIADVEEYSSEDRNFRVDLIITRDFNSEKNLKENIFSLDSEITHFAIDFTFGTTYEAVFAKIFKGYQTKNRFLIIIMLRENEFQDAQSYMAYIQAHPNIKYRQNIRIINYEQYLKFLNLTYDVSNWNSLSAIRSKINLYLRKSVVLAIDAIDDNEKLNELIDLSRKSKN